MQEYEGIFTILAGILGGGFAVKLLDYFKENSKNKSDSYKELLARLEIEMNEVKSENKILRAEIDLIKERNSKLENQIILMQSSDNLYPFPMWLKAPNGTMLVINDEYEKIFGVTKEQYIGKTDQEVWGNEVGANFWENDLKVLRGKSLWVGFEKVPAGFGEWMIIKFPLKVGNVVIGLKGYAIPISDEDQKTLNKIKSRIKQ